MADKNIGLLPQVSTLTDNSSFVCEDSGEAKRVTGKQFKDFAKEGALPAVKAAESAADRAEVALTKTPKIKNDTWWVFDASSQAYVDTGVKAQGERGIQGERGEPGQPGQPGEKGDPFRYEDFTQEQLDDLERGAKAAQAAAETAAASAATSARQASVSEQNAAGSASAAKASEDVAKDSETAAAGSASSAQESAASASTSASEASASATAAAASETSAVEAKTAAETAKTEAGKSASAAKKSETASKASETAAAGSASAAQQSASAAADSATAAAQSAASIGNAEQVVTQKAEEASASAESAAASAEAAARSAEHAAEVVGGDFATKSEAKGYANTAESNAKSYTDQQIAAIPTPDVSGQISTHNRDSTAHNDIRELIDTKIAAIPTPDVSGQISTHNTNIEAHNDIRNLITGLTNRLNALADSDDTTLDQLSEIVAYIKNNKTLIDGITTSKVNVTDVINNLTTNVANKPLSAAQGVALKALIDAITVPTKVSELENDSGYLTSYTETDPTVPAWAKSETKPTYTANEVGAVPTSRTVNGKALSANITLAASDVGALPSNTHIPSTVAEMSDAGNYALKSDKVSKSGDTMTGKLTVPQVETGTGNSNFFQCRKFRGEGNADTYYHAIDFGYQNHDRVDFYEYGGIWSFYKNTSGKVNDSVLCGKITNNGWEGSAKLGSKSTMVTAKLTENSDVIATTAFAHSLVDGMKPKQVSVTLSASGWNSSSKTQAVTVSGVLADETAQLITLTPALTSQTAYYEAGILCTKQEANRLTFTCKTVPTANLTVYVVIQEVTHG